MAGATLGPDTGVDLHLHTTAHDGRWTPPGLVRHCATHGISVMAITDHDTTAGIAPARQAAAPAGVIVVPGVEVTTAWGEREYHLLLYGGQIDPPAPALRTLLSGIWQRHLRQAQELLERLRQRGLSLPSLGAVCRGRDVLPIYIAAAAIRAGQIPGYSAWLALRDELTPPTRVGAPLEAVAAAAHAAGAVALIAHPGRNEGGFTALSEGELDTMISAGPLDGLEVYHPHHSPSVSAGYLAYAARRCLLVSAGSDSHGRVHSRIPTAYPARLVWPLLERCVQPALPADLRRALHTTSPATPAPRAAERSGPNARTRRSALRPPAAGATRRAGG